MTPELNPLESPGNLTCRHCGTICENCGTAIAHPKNGCHYSEWEMVRRLWVDACAPLESPPQSPAAGPLREAVACEIRNIVRTHKVGPTMGSWAECGPIIKGKWMEVADRILALLPASPSPDLLEARKAAHALIRDQIKDWFDISLSSAAQDASDILDKLKEYGYEVRALASTPRPPEAAPAAQVVSPFSKYAHAPWLQPEPVSGVELRREGDYALVEIWLDGVKKLAIKEHLESFFDHHISASGIRGLFGLDNGASKAAPVPAPASPAPKEADHG